MKVNRIIGILLFNEQTDVRHNDFEGCFFLSTKYKDSMYFTSLINYPSQTVTTNNLNTHQITLLYSAPSD
jgi:hypothetical protein